MVIVVIYICRRRRDVTWFVQFVWILELVAAVIVVTIIARMMKMLGVFYLSVWILLLLLSWGLQMMMWM